MSNITANEAIIQFLDGAAPLASVSDATAATGTILLDTVADGNIVTVNDGTNTPVVFEFDTGVKATGAVVLASGRPAAGNTVNLHDVTFEFLKAAKSTGSVVLSGRVERGNSITLHDETFEITKSEKAAGSITLADRPADGNTVALHDEIFEFIKSVKSTGAIGLTDRAADGYTVALHGKTFEFNLGVRASGSIVLAAARPSVGDTVTLHGVTFEFTMGAGVTTPGNIELDMTANSDVEDDGIQLLTALKANIAGLNHAGTSGALDTDYTITLLWSTIGSAGNSVITVSGVTLTKTDMANGASGVSVPEYINVELYGNTTKEQDGAALLAAIKSEIPALVNSTGDSAISLVWNVFGPAGDSVVTISGANLTKTNMTGGVDAEVTTVGNVPVNITANTTKAQDGTALLTALKATIPGLVDSTGTDSLSLIWNVVGATGNSAITVVGANLSKTDLAGGDDGAVTVNSRVAIDIASSSSKEGDGDLILAALKSTIPGLIDSTVATSANTTISLVWNVIGVAGDSTIVVVGNTLTRTNMTGGNDGVVTSEGNIGVDIFGAANLTAEGVLLLAALKANIAGLNNAQTVGALNTDYTITLTWSTVGTVGNATVTVVGANLSKTNMTGGVNIGNNITGGRTGVAIGADTNITATNLAAAINAATLLISAYCVPVPANVVYLEHDNTGVTGNVAITKTGNGITVTGMSGGSVEVTLRTLYDAITSLSISIDPGDVNIGNVDVASIAAGDNNIGNVDIISISAGTNTIGAVYDAGSGVSVVLGVTGAVVKSADMSTATAVTAAPTSGQKLVITDLLISVGSTALEFAIEEETSGTELFYIYAQANTTYHLVTRGKFKLPTADKKLMIDASGAGNIAVTCMYYSES